MGFAFPRPGSNFNTRIRGHFRDAGCGVGAFFTHLNSPVHKI